MTVTIYPDIGSSVFDGVTRAYYGADPVSLLDWQGLPLVDPVVPTPPLVTVPPALRPAAAALGDSVTIELGAADGRPTPEADWDLTLNGNSIRDRVDEFMAIELSEPGLYELHVTWTNESGSVTAGITGLMIDAPPEVEPVDYTKALLYIDAKTPFEGTAAGVTAISAIGSAAARLVATGTGNAVTHTDAGFVFNDGIWLQSQILSGLATGDGLFAVIEATLTAYGSTGGQILNGAGGRVTFSNESGQLRSQAADDTQMNVNLGATPYGSRIVLAGQIDDVLDRFDVINASGGAVSNLFVNTDPAPTRFNCGRYLIGTIHRIAIFGKPEGGAFPYTMEQIHADFRKGA